MVYLPVEVTTLSSILCFYSSGFAASGSGHTTAGGFIRSLKTASFMRSKSAFSTCMPMSTGITMPASAAVVSGICHC